MKKFACALAAFAIVASMAFSVSKAVAEDDPNAACDPIWGCTYGDGGSGN